MEIRNITENDAENFIQLLCKIDDSGFMLYEPGERKVDVEQQRIKIRNILDSKNSMTFIAETDDKLVGYLMAIGGQVNRNKHVAHLALGVIEEYRGQGIASELFNSLLLWVKETDISRLELTVIKHNNKAIQLYQKFGFIIEGESINSLMIGGKPINEYNLYKLV